MTDLLSKLLELSRTVNELNIIKDPDAKFASSYNRPIAEVDKINLFGQRCAECEDDLAKLFGLWNINDARINVYQQWASPS